MLDQSIQSLNDLAANDPAVRPLALLQVEALRDAANPDWDQSAASLTSGQVQLGIPLLHQQVLPVDPEPVHGLLNRLIATANKASVAGTDGLQSVDPLALLQASIIWDDAALSTMAGETGADPPALATIGHLMTLPVLLACARQAKPLMPSIPWTAGFCPLCAAWPALAELRGLDRQRWLRCGRCGSGWRTRHQECVFCDNSDHQTLGYLAPEDDRESRRATTCDKCHSYLKALTTVAPLTPPEILRQDLATLELDLAATGQGYGRPARPGFSLQVEIIPAPKERQGWRPWR